MTEMYETTKRDRADKEAHLQRIFLLLYLFTFLIIDVSLLQPRLKSNSI